MTATGFFTRMTPEAFNFYAEKAGIPWQWLDDQRNPGWLEANEVACIAGHDCSDRFVPNASPSDLFWLEAASVAASGIPVSSLQVVLDRWRDGTPDNNIPFLACKERAPQGRDRECRDLLNQMYDSTRTDPGKYHGGDLVGFHQSLPYIKTLGFDAVWISPLWENAIGFAPGAGAFAEKNGITGYHGYWGADFGWLDPHLGTDCWANANNSIEPGECRQRDLNLVTLALGDFQKEHISIQIDAIMNHAGPRTKPTTNKYGKEMGTLEAGNISFQGENVLNYWDEHRDMGLSDTGHDPDPVGNTSIRRFFHHTPNIDHWTFTPASYCGYIKRMEQGTLADLPDLNVYGNTRAHNLIIDTAKFWSQFGAGVRFDTLIYVSLPDSCENPYVFNGEFQKNIVIEATEYVRQSKRGYSPIVGEWFDFGHPLDMFDAASHLYLKSQINPDSQIDLFDFGFKYGAHDVFGGKFRSLQPMHDYLERYTKQPFHYLARRSPFVDNHDMPVLLNEQGWPTYEDLHQATIISFLFPGTPYIYGQNLRYLHDTIFREGLFGRGGDPFNRIMVDAPAGDNPPIDYPMERLVTRLNQFRREYAAALMFGSFTSGFKNRDDTDFGNENRLAIKRMYMGESVLYLHLRQIDDDSDQSPNTMLKTVRVDMPAGRYTDPITLVQYDVTSNGQIKSLPGTYTDPVWQRTTTIDQSGDYHLANQRWMHPVIQKECIIEGSRATIPAFDKPGEAVIPHSPDPDHPEKFRIIQRERKLYPADGRYRLRNEDGVENIVDIEDGKIEMKPKYLTIILAQHDERYDWKELARDYVGVENKPTGGR